MNTEPLHIDGVAGPVVVTTRALWGSPTVTVGGVPAPRSGKRGYTLPAATGGSVGATVRSAFADPYPTVEVNGVVHRTGPPVPVFLRVLAPLPILLIAIGGALGGLLGGLGFVANLDVARTRMPSAAKALIMIGVAALAFVLFLAISAVVRGAVSSR